MAQFRIALDCDNAVFDRPYTADAVADVLLDASKRIRRTGLPTTGLLRDNNGNSIGRWDYSETNNLNS